MYLISLYESSWVINCVTFSVVSFSEIIVTNTIAGYEDCADGGLATSARLNGPSGVAVDASGNLYIADISNRRIRLVTKSTGIITTVAGNGNYGYGGDGDGGLATLARLMSPSGVAVDASGNIYIADTFNNCIRLVTRSTGIITTVAGNGGGLATSAKLSLPSDVTVDTSGNLYIADTYNHRIQLVTKSTGIITTVAGNGTRGYGRDGGPATLSRLDHPRGVAVDASGNIYIADTGNTRIRIVTKSTGIISTLAGNGYYGGDGDGGLATSASLYPFGISVDASGNLYIADTYNHRIRLITKSTGIITTVAGNGTRGYGGDGGLAIAAPLNDPRGVAVDASGNIYIADIDPDRIRLVTKSTGIITTVAGIRNEEYGEGVLATSAKFYSPRGVAVDASGNVYIADTSNHRIRLVTKSTGIITTVAGNGTDSYGGDGGLATSARLNSPRGVAVDASGNLYIADSDNGRIRMVAKSTGIITTVAGNGNSGYGGDGGLATVAPLNDPRGVAVDASGNIYIAEFWSHLIRLVTKSTGIITTVARGGNYAYGGQATSANFLWPRGVTVDASGNVYIADSYSNCIRLITKITGIITIVAGNGTRGYGGDGGPATVAPLNDPHGVAVDASGNIYIADTYNHRIRLVTKSTGIITTVIGSEYYRYGEIGGLYYPHCVAVDKSGNIYFADAFHDLVFMSFLVEAPSASPSPNLLIPPASPTPSSPSASAIQRSVSSGKMSYIFLFRLLPDCRISYVRSANVTTDFYS